MGTFYESKALSLCCEGRQGQRWRATAEERKVECDG